MWANADDQGRLGGDPEELKYTCCPNIDHVTKADIPELLQELARNELIKLYITHNSPQSGAVQLLDWWHPTLGHRPQWASPSQYSPPEGWADRLRYHRTPTEIITENWVPPGQFNRELPTALGSKLRSDETEEKRTKIAPQKRARSEENKRNQEEGSKNQEAGKQRSALGNALRNGEKTIACGGKEREGNLGFIAQTYENNISELTPIISDQLKDIAQTYPPAWFEEAVKEAVAANVRRLSYIKAILERWHVDGFKTKKEQKGEKHGKRTGLLGNEAKGRLAALAREVPEVQ